MKTRYDVAFGSRLSEGEKRGGGRGEREGKVGAREEKSTGGGGMEERGKRKVLERGKKYSRRGC